MPPHTILVAEDFEPFRAFVCGELRRRPDVSVVPVGDGLAAVRHAEALRPDLVLLDIGLPTVNGIAAAERIRLCCPQSKILFLTQESSPDVIEAALQQGARGYIHKMRAHGYMMAAVEAILDGSTGPTGQPPKGTRNGAAPPGHDVQFYGDEQVLLENVECVVVSALASGAAAIVVLTRPHLDALEARLRRQRSLVDRAAAQGTFLSLDATALLSGVAGGDETSWERLRAGFVDAVAAAGLATGQPRPRVAVIGEPAALLLEAGHIDAADRIEQIGRELTESSTLPAVHLTCAYPLSLFAPDDPFKRVCGAHAVMAVR